MKDRAKHCEKMKIGLRDVASKPSKRLPPGQRLERGEVGDNDKSVIKEAQSKRSNLQQRAWPPQLKPGDTAYRFRLCDESLLATPWSLSVVILKKYYVVYAKPSFDGTMSAASKLTSIEKRPTPVLV